MGHMLSILAKLVSGGTYMATAELTPGQVVVESVEVEGTKIDLILSVDNRGRVVEIYIEKSKGVLK